MLYHSKFLLLNVGKHSKNILNFGKKLQKHNCIFGKHLISALIDDSTTSKTAPFAKWLMLCESTSSGVIHLKEPGQKKTIQFPWLAVLTVFGDLGMITDYT